MPGYIDELLAGVARDVRATLAGELGPQPLSELVDELFALEATLIDALRERTPAVARKLPVCQPGCDSCCHLHAVFVTPAEALRLADHLRATRTAAELDALVVRLRDVAARTAEMTKEERARARIGCPLLDAQGACSVHPARPLLCRAYNSCDLGACHAAFEAGTAATRLLCDEQQMSVGKTLFAALLLGGGAGRAHGPFELVHALLAALTTERATERWIAGEAIFSVDETRISREAAPEWAAFTASHAGH